MKKILILMIAILAMVVQTVSAQEYPNIMLHHNGKATVYKNTQLSSAVSAAVDGDTIYIPAANCNNQDITINKKITIMGQGTSSRLANITVNIPIGANSASEIEMTSTLLYGISAGTLTVNSSLTNLHIDKCTFSGITLQPNSSTSTKTLTMKNMLIERCKITDRLQTNVNYDIFENGIFRNCNIQYFSNRSKDISFINCTLFATYGMYTRYNGDPYYTDYVYGNYINCIVKTFCRYYTSGYTNYGGYIIDSSASFVNCLYGQSRTAGTGLDCWYNSSAVNYTDEELRFNGYLGTDGTIVGCNGGSRPFNLVPSVPSLEDIKLDVNYTTRKLNVTVKVKAN